jgi:RNA polymerase-binding transcription factor DksA
MLSAEFIKEMREKLLAAKAKLEADLSPLSAHEELGSDMDSSAQEVEDDEVSQDLIAKLKTDLEKINLALEKIDNGSYGTGSDGKEIPEDRLRALPWADKAL